MENKFGRVGVVMGGKSSEREISIRSGNAVLTALKLSGISAEQYDVDARFFDAVKNKSIDVVFIAIHGRYGEDGTIQGMLELAEIPYTGPGILASSLAINKVMCKKCLESSGISTPEYAWVENGSMKGKWNPEFPCVIKPSCEGSSIGMSIVREKGDFEKAVEDAKKYDRLVLIEKYVDGRELTVGIIGSKNPRTLPVIEIKPSREFYNYEAKYTKGLTEFVVPAGLPDEVTLSVQREALSAYNAVGCYGMSRVDVMLDGNNVPYVLEINTIPGLTELSLLPKAARAGGIEFNELVIKLLEFAIERR